MKLYNLKRGDKFSLAEAKVKLPPASLEINLLDTYTFQHVDGMYSFCLDKEGGIVHFAAWTEVNKEE